jgi:hypothetical protein
MRVRRPTMLAILATVTMSLSPSIGGLSALAGDNYTTVPVSFVMGPG